MHPRRALVALGLVALLLTGSAAGWRPVGPPALPHKAYVPVEGGPSSDRTLASDTIELHGSKFVVDVVGAGVRGPYEFRLRVFHAEEGGARLWPLRASMTSDVGETRADYEREPGRVNLGGDGILVAGIDFQPSRHYPSPETFELQATFKAYREVGVGVWRVADEDITLTFELASTR